MTPQDLAFFHKEGYLKIHGSIPSGLLLRLQQLFDEFINEDHYPHKITQFIAGKKYVTSLIKLLNKGNLACLELLGCPSVLNIAKDICGPDFFLIQDFGVIKMLGDHSPELWHQDVLNQRTGNCITMGIYLDDANPGDGALRVVPGSHNNGRNICDLLHEPSIEIPMKAGEILVHDMMLAHCSDLMTFNQLRRVLYFEFLSETQVKNENMYNSEVLENRFHILQIAIEYYRAQHPREEKFEWDKMHAAENKDPVARKKQLDLLYDLEINAKTYAYCFESFENPLLADQVP